MWVQEPEDMEELISLDKMLVVVAVGMVTAPPEMHVRPMLVVVSLRSMVVREEHLEVIRPMLALEDLAVAEVAKEAAMLLVVVAVVVTLVVAQVLTVSVLAISLEEEVVVLITLALLPQTQVLPIQGKAMWR